MKCCVLRAPAQPWSHLNCVDHLNFAVFTIIKWKIFQWRFLSKKKKVNHFSESLTFASAMIYQNEVRKKHPRMLIFYGAMDNQERDLESIFSSTLVTCFSDRSPSGDACIVLLCYFCTFLHKMVMIIWCLAMIKTLKIITILSHRLCSVWSLHLHEKT